MTVIYPSVCSNDNEKKNLDSTVKELVDDVTTLTESTICNDDMITMVSACSGFCLGSVIALYFIVPHIDYFLTIDYYTLLIDYFIDSCGHVKALYGYFFPNPRMIPDTEAWAAARAAEVEDCIGPFDRDEAFKLREYLLNFKGFSENDIFSKNFVIQFQPNRTHLVYLKKDALRKVFTISEVNTYLFIWLEDLKPLPPPKY